MNTETVFQIVVTLQDMALPGVLVALLTMIWKGYLVSVHRAKVEAERERENALLRRDMYRTPSPPVTQSDPHKEKMDDWERRLDQQAKIQAVRSGRAFQPPAPAPPPLPPQAATPEEVDAVLNRIRRRHSPGEFMEYQEAGTGRVRYVRTSSHRKSKGASERTTESRLEVEYSGPVNTNIFSDLIAHIIRTNKPKSDDDNPFKVTEQKR